MELFQEEQQKNKLYFLLTLLFTVTTATLLCVPVKNMSGSAPCSLSNSLQPLQELYFEGPSFPIGFQCILSYYLVSKFLIFSSLPFCNAPSFCKSFVHFHWQICHKFRCFMEQHAILQFTNQDKSHVIFMFTLKLNYYQLLANMLEEQILCTEETYISPAVSPSV